MAQVVLYPIQQGMDLGLSHGNGKASPQLGFDEDPPVQEVEEDLFLFFLVDCLLGAAVIEDLLIGKVDLEEGSLSCDSGFVPVTVEEGREPLAEVITQPRKMGKRFSGSAVSSWPDRQPW